MTYWIREFVDTESGQRFRVYSETEYLPPLRKQVAEKQKDPRWTDDMIFKHDAGLDTKFDGNCPLTIALIISP
jgi:hypothetical protein